MLDQETFHHRSPTGLARRLALAALLLGPMPSASGESPRLSEYWLSHGTQPDHPAFTYYLRREHLEPQRRQALRLQEELATLTTHGSLDGQPAMARALTDWQATIDALFREGGRTPARADLTALLAAPRHDPRVSALSTAGQSSAASAAAGNAKRTASRPAPLERAGNLRALFERFDSRPFTGGLQRRKASLMGFEVGAVAAREVSRFARNSRDWQRLIEVCRVVDTLLLDHETVYAPRQSNDRLLLGLPRPRLRLPQLGQPSLRAFARTYLPTLQVQQRLLCGKRGPLRVCQRPRPQLLGARLLAA